MSKWEGSTSEEKRQFAVPDFAWYWRERERRRRAWRKFGVFVLWFFALVAAASFLRYAFGAAEECGERIGRRGVADIEQSPWRGAVNRYGRSMLEQHPPFPAGAGLPPLDWEGDTMEAPASALAVRAWCGERWLYEESAT